MLNCMSSLYSLDISTLSDRSFANISPIQQVAFHSVDSFLCCAEAFQNDVVIVVFVAFGIRFKNSHQHRDLYTISYIKLCCCCQVTSVMSDSVRPHRRQPPGSHPWDSPGKNTGVGCHFLLQCMEVKSESEVAQPCLTLRDPMDCSPPGFSVHGVFQARVLKWVNPLD